MISGNYSKEWNSAIERTKKFGLTAPEKTNAQSHSYLTNARHAEFPFIVQRGLGNLELDDVVAQCMSIHYRLAPVIQEWLGCPVYYTLGWVDDGTTKGLFKFDDDFILEKLEKGHHDSSISIHAWLTLPSMEVIDISLATSIAVAQNLPQGRGGVIASHADKLNGMAYKPMLVGSDFLKRCGVFIEW